MSHPHRLQVYVSEYCVGCVEAARLAREMAQQFPSVRVEVIDVQALEVVLPDNVFATPTYLWDGAVYSLGNPTREALAAMITARLVEVDP
ncbi:MAG: thioredoxin family protein [Chloroflexota bacterium]